jgi:hypothetical protein
VPTSSTALGRFAREVKARAGAAGRALFSGHGGGPVGSAAGPGYWPSRLPGTRVDHAALAGDPWLNGAVAACLKWIGDNFCEPQLTVAAVGAAGKETPDPDHPLLARVERPNPFYDTFALFQATALSYQVAGQAFWLDVEGESGPETWFVPHWEMTPGYPADGSKFLTHWVRRIDAAGPPQVYLPDEVTHFRYGIDPRNQRAGLCYLNAVLREVVGDNQASTFTSAILRNMGVAGVVISPSAPDGRIDPEEAEAIVARYERRALDGAGRPLILSGPVRTDQAAMTPNDMALDRIRQIPEDRICAALGVNPMVAGLTSGAAHKTYANYGEAIQAAYHGCLIPMQSRFASTLRWHLLPRLGRDPLRERVRWDYSKVQALQEDRKDKSSWVIGEWQAGLIQGNEARNHLGYEPLPDFDVLFNEVSPPEPEKPAALPKPAADEGPDGAGPEEDAVKSLPAPRMKAKKGAVGGVRGHWITTHTGYHLFIRGPAKDGHAETLSPRKAAALKERGRLVDREVRKGDARLEGRLGTLRAREDAVAAHAEARSGARHAATQATRRAQFEAHLEAHARAFPKKLEAHDKRHAKRQAARAGKEHEARKKGLTKAHEQATARDARDHAAGQARRRREHADSRALIVRGHAADQAARRADHAARREAHAEAGAAPERLARHDAASRELLARHDADHAARLGRFDARAAAHLAAHDARHGARQARHDARHGARLARLDAALPARLARHDAAHAARQEQRKINHAEAHAARRAEFAGREAAGAAAHAAKAPGRREAVRRAVAEREHALTEDHRDALRARLGNNLDRLDTPAVRAHRAREAGAAPIRGLEDRLPLVGGGHADVAEKFGHESRYDPGTHYLGPATHAGGEHHVPVYRNAGGELEHVHTARHRHHGKAVAEARSVAHALAKGGNPSGVIRAG